MSVWFFFSLHSVWHFFFQDTTDEGHGVGAIEQWGEGQADI